jgi:hypothetical protein
VKTKYAHNDNRRRGEKEDEDPLTMTMVSPNTIVNGHHGMSPMNPKGLSQLGAVAAGEVVQAALDAGMGPHPSL